MNVEGKGHPRLTPPSRSLLGPRESSRTPFEPPPSGGLIISATPSNRVRGHYVITGLGSYPPAAHTHSRTTQGEAASAGSVSGLSAGGASCAPADVLAKRRAAALGLKPEERWAEIR